ncbi:hypothetical protein [Bacillus sp. FSL R9-9410]|uniref:hypothetical protein n=1 Tax=Bacillus sp. FSL R9-9410 TaxID=2921590 RepID=UPI0031018C08
MEEEKERGEVREKKYTKVTGYVRTCIGIFFPLLTGSKIPASKIGEYEEGSGETTARKIPIGEGQNTPLVKASLYHFTIVNEKT